MKLSAVVTGVSTGIGYATAQTLADNGFHIFGSVRRVEDADRLKAKIGSQFTPLLFDLRDIKAIEAAAHLVRSSLNGQCLTALVNNAAIGVGGPLALQPIEEIRQHFEINVVGTIAVTQAFIPLLGSDPSLHGNHGRIVNISSIGGRVGFPLIAAYAGTKFALEGISESLRRELLVHGIEVIVIAPHSTNTPLLDKAEAQDASRYQNTPYQTPIKRVLDSFVSEGRKGYHPRQIADVIYKAITAKKPRARYSVVPKPLEAWLLSYVFPTRFIDRLMAKQFGLLRQSSMSR
jgi:short-subunit dehydrogenase